MAREQNIIVPLISLGERSSDVIVLLSCVAMYSSFAQHKESRREMVEHGGLSLLVKFCIGKDLAVVRKALGVVAQMAMFLEPTNAFVLEQMLPLVVRLFKQAHDDEVHRHCLGALAGLASHESIAEVLVRDGMIHDILGLAQPWCIEVVQEAFQDKCLRCCS